MRKLGKGQSVMFCAPPEIERKILACNGKSVESDIEVSDVLVWSITETWRATEKGVSLWATQGMRYLHRDVIWSESASKEDFSVDTAKALLEQEAQSLETRYGFGERQDIERVLLQNGEAAALVKYQPQVEAIREKCQSFKVESLSSATLQEEQERELSPESEKERQIERPPAMAPYVHSTHADVWSLVRTGQRMPSSTALQSAFDVFDKTTAANFFDSNAWPKRLFATTDFVRTVHITAGQALDDYLRPVNWILSLKNEDEVEYVVISPHEANELLPTIRNLRKVTLHVYAPRTNLSIRSFEDLCFCAVPSSIRPDTNPESIRLLNIFAGQLFMKDYDEYVANCQFLGLCSEPPPETVEVACDGFISSKKRVAVDSTMARVCPFEKSPVEFLRILIGFRTKGQGFARSHVGRILHSELLSQRDFTELE